jgi:hypothetical protein
VVTASGTATSTCAVHGSSFNGIGGRLKPYGAVALLFWSFGMFFLAI